MNSLNLLCDFGMTRAADYLERAALIEANARQMSLDEHRNRLLELAAAWRQMAEQELRREHRRLPAAQG